LEKSSRPPCFPFASSAASYWHNARAAIWQGVRALGLVPGDRILVPAYACGSELDALIKAGLDLDFYRLQPDLQADLSHIESLADRRFRAIYTTHYFGFPQPVGALRDIAYRFDAYLIEDNALGLYAADASSRPLGSTGDACIFSLTKSLPLPDGGVLVLQNEKSMPMPERKPASRVIAGRLKSLIQATVDSRAPAIGNFVRNLVTSPLARATKRRARPWPSQAGPSGEDESALDVRRANWGLSGVSAALLKRIDHAAVAETRRRNYQILHASINRSRAARPLMPDLPAGACPAFFPLWTESAAQLHRHLRYHGVESVRFWLTVHRQMPLNGFPFELSLKEHVLRLPIHQDLSDRSMESIARAINAWTHG
jgi:dTDP-4-amino-4,6-dideoxygalactose transaminase